MYSGVPMIWPALVSPAPVLRSAPSTFAIPKSISRTSPRLSRMMLVVLRSRWTIPTSWIACSPSAIWIARSNPSSGLRQPPRSRASCFRSVPSTNSIEM